MAKHKYIDNPKILRPDIEFLLPYNKNSDGFYLILPKTNHIGGKNCLRDLASKKIKEGYIYFIRIKDTNKYKIGVSVNPKKRLSSIASALPFELEVLAIDKIKEPYIFEQIIIDRHISKLIKNEWFELSNKDAVDIIINLHNRQFLDYGEPTY